MLQQTQVKTVIPYFENFVETIPNLKALSKTSERKILKMWEGLGYYRRAKNLLKTVKILDQILNGEKPKPGSYRGRKNSEPELSRKTLLENENA